MPKPRTVGVVRLSAVGDREPEHLHSPTIQRDKMTRACKLTGERLVAVLEEIDVSGRRPLAKRKGLLRAVEMVENNEADHIMVAYMDRLVRSIKVQLEVVERVEKAGGEIYTLDHGKLTNGNAAQKVTSGVLGLMAEFHANVTSEKVSDVHGDKVAKGIWPGSRIVPGYLRGPDGRLVPDERLVAVMVTAFTMRDEHAPWSEIQDYLRDHGIDRSVGGIQSILESRTFLGEIVFGKWKNPAAHPAIIDRALWERVQGRRIPAGRQAKSDRLLARLGVVRCASCDGRMTVGCTSRNYLCNSAAGRGRCTSRPAINADLLEAVIVERLKAQRELAEVKGSASPDGLLAEEAAEAQADLEAAIRAFAGVMGERAAGERIAELTEIRDEKAAIAALAGQHGEARKMIRRMDDWDTLTLAGRRAIIRACVSRVTVAKATTRKWQPSRINVQLFGEG